jgi:hypothetical protein
MRCCFSGLFDFVLGFSAVSVLPLTVMPRVLVFVKDVFLNRKHPYDTYSYVFNDPKLATATPINLIYRDGAQVLSKQIVYSHYSGRMWGIEPNCGNPDCPNIPGNIKYRTQSSNRHHNHDFIKCECLHCHWSTPAYVERPHWLKPLKDRFFFVHDYPLSETQASTFTLKMVSPEDEGK